MVREKLVHPLITERTTRVFHEAESEQKFGAPHHFEVYTAADHSGVEPKLVGEVHFQEGPVGENGVNGIANEDALAMVLTRLEHFQNGPYACRANALAITKLEECLMWLRKRTLDREMRGVLGTSAR